MRASGYQFTQMSHEHLEIMDDWSYGPYFPDFGVEAYHASARLGVSPPTGPGGCDGFAVLNEDDELVGIFEYYFGDDGTASIGLALSPTLTNQGLGRGFLEAGVEFLMTNYNYGGTHVHLSVDPRNEPARKLYARAGFELVAPDPRDGELHMRRPTQPRPAD